MSIFATAATLANMTGFTGERWVREFNDTVDFLLSA